MPCVEQGCCPEQIKSKNDSFGWDSCPEVGEPCGWDEESSCAGATVQGFLESDDFKIFCFNNSNLVPKVDVSMSADNWGHVQGKSSKLFTSNQNSNACIIGYVEGTIADPEIIPGKKPGHKRMKISYFGKNAPHGGPYGIFLTAVFYFENIS